MAQSLEVAAEVRRAPAGLAPAGGVHCVEVKGPLLTPALVEDAARRADAGSPEFALGFEQRWEAPPLPEPP